MNEIGGYLQLEEFQGEPLYSNVRKLNLGRTAIQYALQVLGVRELWLPRYLCDSMLDACAACDCRLRLYRVDDALQPDLSDWQPAAGAWILFVNYYGQYSPDRIRAWQRRYGQILVDNTQAFYQPPVEGVPTLYSMRKYFGLPDGGYLYLPDTVDDSAAYEALEQDRSGARVSHLLGRYEDCAGPYYQQMLATADSFHGAPVRKMSKLTENLLRAIPYEADRRRREENWRVLQAALGRANPLNWPMPAGPFVYPFYHSSAAALKRQLAAQKIFVPTYWNNVVRDEPEDTAEYRLAANILPLPCDQRYGAADMNRMASALLALLERADTADA